MQDCASPWNKRLAVGQKKAFTLNEILLIASYLHEAGKARDLALFALGITSMLRSIDLVHLKVQDVLDNRNLVMDRFAVMQHKTHRPVVVQIDTFSQKVVSRWIEESDKSLDDYLFTGLTPSTKFKRLSRSHLRTLVKSWARAIGLDPTHYSTHSLRRSRASLLYNDLLDPEVLRVLLGQTSIAATSAYLGISLNYALNLAEERPIFTNLLTLLRNPL